MRNFKMFRCHIQTSLYPILTRSRYVKEILRYFTFRFIGRIDSVQCERRCDASMDGFICRGYTFDNSSGKPVCLLHSEDTTSLGVSSLIDATKTIYRERELCLDCKLIKGIMCTRCWNIHRTFSKNQF